MNTKPRRDLRPVPLANATLDDAFWAPRQETNLHVTLPHEYRLCKCTGRVDAMKLAGKPGRPHPPHQFWDSDVAKWIEAASYSLATAPNPALERQIDHYVRLMVRAQHRDGYLNSFYQATDIRKRWTNLRDMHELYCAGHLMEAAVAYHAATGKRAMLDVMCRYADHIGRTFGRGPRQKRGYPGHEEIELALVKLYRATGTKRYLDLARYFVDERGQQPHYFDREAKRRGEAPRPRGVTHPYDAYQAHAPVREQRTAEGHAVRALYLYSGMADVAAETGDRTLLAACRRLWKNITEKRMYITGGVGSTRHGERFTVDYDLPNDTAYAETCANIALVFFAHRMLHLELDGTYADAMERALYNGVLSGVSLDGKRFFYDNLLTAVPDVYRFRGQKSPWRPARFGCACCPPHNARLLASLVPYVWSSGPDRAAVHLYVAGRARFEIAGQNVEIRQRTNYPWAERVRLEIRPQAPARFTLSLRLPGWCRRPELAVNGKRMRLSAVTRRGYAHIRRLWRAGDRVDLLLPMPIERMEAHPHVQAACGCIALQRGPVVYCLEEADNGKILADIVLPRQARLRIAPGPRRLRGAPVITGRGLRRDRTRDTGALYRPAGTRTRPVTLRAVPYCLWNNRGDGEMRVWIREG